MAEIYRLNQQIVYDDGTRYTHHNNTNGILAGHQLVSTHIHVTTLLGGFHLRQLSHSFETSTFLTEKTPPGHKRPKLYCSGR
jgi:hypothetical protein